MAASRRPGDPPGGGGRLPPQRKAHPGILVADLDALAARLESHDVPVEWDDNFPGMRRFYASDNNGNRLEFLTPR